MRNMDTILTDPVSGAPTFEPAVMSFTMPPTRSVIAVTQTSLTTDCTDSTGTDAQRHHMRGGVQGFTKDATYSSNWDRVASLRLHLSISQ